MVFVERTETGGFIIKVKRIGFRTVVFAIAALFFLSISVSAADVWSGAGNVSPELSAYSVVRTTSYSNDVTFPFPDYPATLKVDWDKTGIQVSFPHQYAGSSECDGFAKYAHDRYYHITNWNRAYPSWDTGSGYTADYKAGFTWNSQAEVETFFRSLSKGAFIRYVSRLDQTPDNGTHSVVFDGIVDDGNGIIVYECNMDGACGVGYQNYTFYALYQNYASVLYYVDHEISTTAFAADINYHTNSCVNCAGYLRCPHTGSATYVQIDEYEHYAQFSCCHGTLQVPHTMRGTVCSGCGYRSDAMINSSDAVAEE